jgi:tRNA uridine 5-carboxymethylaminomethyl modification enzyme
VQVNAATAILERLTVRPSAEADELLASLGTSPLLEPQPAANLLRRPQIGFADLLGLLDAGDAARLASVRPEVVEQLVIRAQYDGYIQRQLADIARHRATEHTVIPRGIDFVALEGMTFEARDKLTRLRPDTLGQASRIAGVSPADVSVLMMHLHRLGGQAGGVVAEAPGGETVETDATH